MKKWGPAVFIAAVLGALLFWSACGEPDIARHGEASTEELLNRTEGTLGPRPDGAAWSASGLVAPDLGALGAVARSLGSATPKDHDVWRVEGFTVSDVAELEGALAAGKGGTDDVLVSRARMHAVAMQAWSFLKAYDKALARFVVADEELKQALATAQTLDQWQEAESARLYFVDSVRAVARVENWARWSPETLSQIAERLGGPIHRATLVRVLHLRFLDEVVPGIATASKSDDPAEVVCSALFEEQSDEQTLLVARLLHRHPRAFGPDLTADAGAGAVKSLREAAAGPWPGAQAVLDDVAVAHAPWTALLDFLRSGDASQVSKIADVKSLIDTTENPVGLALLHEERTGWSSLVQGAYVADAKEALLRIELFVAAGKRDGAQAVVDPLTGGPFTVEGESATSGLGPVPDAYPFVKSFVETKHSIGV